MSPLRQASLWQAPNTIECADFRDWLPTVEAGSVDLVLTDPPYAISQSTGFLHGGLPRLRLSMDFGEWDHQPIDIDALALELYRVLRDGGTAIVWYSLWKLESLRDALERAGFGMFRQIIWQRTNPVPLNARSFYLSNSRDMAVACVKGNSPTFYGDRAPSGKVYDRGLYERPISHHGGERLHPTQKDIGLFRTLVEKHSNEGDLVIDPFVGSGTTAVACQETGRAFAGCDSSEEYVQIARQRTQVEVHEWPAP